MPMLGFPRLPVQLQKPFSLKLGDFEFCEGAGRSPGFSRHIIIALALEPRC
jgi:hypothetical protein